MLARLLRPFRKYSLTSARIEEEITDLIDHGAESGAIPRSSGEMIQSIFEFSDTVVKKIMTPRIKVIGVDQNATIGEVIDIVKEQGYSRLPIYNGDLDHIVGFLMAKDLLNYWGTDGKATVPKELLRPVILVHANRLIGDILSELLHKKSHIAVVLDEYGGTAGLVTMEDIIEEIIGDINDEYDVDQEKDIRETEPGVFIATGHISISDLNEALPEPIPEGDYETLGGFLTDQVSRVPAPDEKIRFGDYVFHIRAADNRKVDEVEIRRFVPEDSSENQAEADRNRL
jgi:magnesium and cobalt transporter